MIRGHYFPARVVISRVAQLFLLFFAVSGLLCAQDSADQAPQASAPNVCNIATLGSPYIPVDSWIYPAMWRLYGLGYVDTVFLGERPWTIASVERMLEEASARLETADGNFNSGAVQALQIRDAILRQLQPDIEGPCGRHHGRARVQSVYTIARGISGTPLDDSFHLGSTIINDYGRPYEHGFNNYTGASGYVTAGRFAVYARAEFQAAPSAAGYSPALYEQLSSIDGTGSPLIYSAYPGQTTIPEGPIPAVLQGRFLEAYASFQYLNHIFSFGKQDQWLGPDQGGSFAYSNNAQNIYGFEINRIEPLHVPFLSDITGPFRYEFLVGALRGHQLMPNPLFYPGSGQPNVVSPGDPWVHVEKVSFQPTSNFQLGFERTVIWGGEGHSPVTIGDFLRSFFSTYSPDEAIKFGPKDPGARFGSFDLTYRLPFLRNWLTFYTDGEVHDDISPIDAPRRAAWAPGLYLSHVPGLPKLDVRVEAAMTDPAVSSSHGGVFMYWEGIERQGYTNQGQIFGHWIGREAKGGQAWLTYHLSGDEWIQVGLRNQKAARDFIPGGTTLNDVNVEAVKRLGRDFQLSGNFTFEHWKAPIYLPGQQTVTATTIELLWRPERKLTF